MKKTILIMLLSIRMLIVNAQDFWEPSGNRNQECLDQFVESGACSLSEKTKEISFNYTDPITCPLGQNYTVKARYIEMVCGNMVVIDFHGINVRKDPSYNCTNNAWDVLDYAWEVAKTDMLASFGGNSMYNNVMFAKRTTCTAPVEVKILPDTCLVKVDAVGGGTTSNTFIQVGSEYIAPLECTGGTCCAGMGTLDGDGNVIDFQLLSAPSVGDCGKPNLEYMKFVLAGNRCKANSIKIGKIGECRSSDCNIDFSGLYGTPGRATERLHKTTKSNETLASKQIELTKVSKNLYRVNYNGEPTNVSVIDLKGKVVLNPKDSNLIDISVLSSGIYLVKANFGSGLKAVKLVKE